MAFDAFLKIVGVDGESRDERHQGEIEIDSYSWGESQSAAAGGGGGGGGAGKVQLQDFHFVARTSKASPVMFFACATGQHFPEATLSLRRAGEDPLDYIKITLSDCLVSSYLQEGVAGSSTVPTDQFSLNFAKIEFTYVPQGADGKAGPPITRAYDRRS